MDIKIIKRDGREELFDSSKIKNAIKKCLTSFKDKTYEENIDEYLTNKVLEKLNLSEENLTVEEIQDLVEKTLMEEGYFEE